ncbi:MAG: hypothetical protein KBT03_13750 [Bacteroidales bacterium]|nr:hypothetical protein [Candidatus Scybalousia scybalohippi]
MPIIRMPDGVNVRFPDDMSRDEIRNKIATKFPDFAKSKTKTSLNPTSEQIAQVKQNNEDYANKSHLQGVGSEGLKGLGQGAISGLGRVLSGATLGASDWIDRKTGGNLQQLDEELQQDAKINGAITSGLNNVAKFGLEMGGNIGGASNLILKGAKSLPKMIGKSAIEGGIYGTTESDTLDELPKNAVGGAIGGGLIAGTLGSIGKGVQRVFPALNSEGLAKNLNDAFTDRESTIALKRGAKASQKLSDEIASEMPLIKDSINSKISNNVDNIIGKTPNIDSRLKMLNNLIMII